MSDRKIKVPMAKLIELLRSSTTRGVNAAHLRDEDFAAYAAEVLPEAEVQRVDRHLADCADCCTEMASLLAAAERWRDLDVREQMKKVREPIADTQAIESSPTYLISTALSGVQRGGLSGSVQGLLARWETWIKALSDDSINVRIWRPVSFGEVLGSTPVAGIERGAPMDSLEMGTPAIRNIDIALKTSKELVLLEVLPGPPVTINVMIKRVGSTYPRLVLLKEVTGKTEIAEAKDDTELPIQTAHFSDVGPGNYLIALSPGGD
jgi:hypothetical protein